MTVPGVGPVVALTYSAAGDGARPLPELQGGRGDGWTDTFRASIDGELIEPAGGYRGVAMR